MVSAQPIAHTENEDGKLHLLANHLETTAKTMKILAPGKEAEEIFHITGLIHDFGKYQKSFQKYLKQNGPRSPHAAVGAALARKLKLNEASFAIDGHHKGLPDKIDWQVSTDKYLKIENLKFTELLNSLPTNLNIDEKDFNIIKPSFNNVFERELFVRYLFSALTDADWLDTENHFNPELTAKRAGRELDYDLLLSVLEADLKLKNSEGKINRLRNEARTFALNKAEMKQGFFSLNLPTGLGKTLTSVNWAIQHAKHHHLKRIIIVLPFVNIIDQTAKELKRIFGEHTVLEHHSSYNEENEKQTSGNSDKSKEKLATENWDFPIIVTTTVQFFESLFANRPSKCRKIHNIANSIVIFDEVQTLPKELVTPTLTILQNVHKIMKTSFLFCTATQPAFEKNDKLQNGIDSITSLVENPQKLFKETLRVKYTFLLKPDYEISEIINMVKYKEESVLSIFNTKKKTLQAFDLTKSSQGWDKCYHLSTTMCPAHRKKIINDIITDLYNPNLKIFVASTQLIEAGVDLDFPVVFREYAPLDSIIQAAGRCNREGKQSQAGEVYVFWLSDKTMPDSLYSSLSDHTMELLEDDIEQIYDPSFFPKYYLSALNLYVDDDRNKINVERKKFNFKTIASVYRIINKPTKSLFIWNYNEDSKQLYERIKYKPGLSRDDFRDIQSYSVQVYDTFLNRTVGMWEEKQQGLRVWFGNYHTDTGIVEDTKLAETII